MSANEAQLKDHVEAMEQRVVKSAKAIIKAGPSLQDVEEVQELERNLEWFLTWRLKFGDVPRVMWCDGVRDLAFHRRANLTYEIEARVYIGPESHTTTTLCPLAGTIEFDETSDRMKAYHLNIRFGEQEFVITNGI